MSMFVSVVHIGVLLHDTTIATYVWAWVSGTGVWRAGKKKMKDRRQIEHLVPSSATVNKTLHCCESIIYLGGFCQQHSHACL